MTSTRGDRTRPPGRRLQQGWRPGDRVLAAVLVTLWPSAGPSGGAPARETVARARTLAAAPLPRRLLSVAIVVISLSPLRLGRPRLFHQLGPPARAECLARLATSRSVWPAALLMLVRGALSLSHYQHDALQCVGWHPGMSGYGGGRAGV